jgi:hypothetical protein
MEALWYGHGQPSEVVRGETPVRPNNALQRTTLRAAADAAR